jgi:hypothetical protein
VKSLRPQARNKNEKATRSLGSPSRKLTCPLGLAQPIRGCPSLAVTSRFEDRTLSPRRPTIALVGGGVHHGDGGGRSRPSAVRAAWILGDGDEGIIPASFSGLDVDAVCFEAHQLMSRCTYLRLTLRALGAGRAFHRDDPTSDVSKSPCRHHTYGPSRRAALKNPQGQARGVGTP